MVKLNDSKDRKMLGANILKWDIWLHQNGLVSTLFNNSYISRETGLCEQSVADLILNELSADEVAYRENKLRLKDKKALATEIARWDIWLHQQGDPLVNQYGLYTQDDLGSIVSVGSLRVSDWLRMGLTEEERLYKAQQNHRSAIRKISNSASAKFEDKKALATEIARWDIWLHQQGQVDELYTNQEIADIVGTSEQFVFSHLKDELTQDERDYRHYKLLKLGPVKSARNQKEKMEQTRSLMIQMVRDEINKHRESLIDKLSDNPEISEVFGINGTTTWSYLSCLSPDEKDYRSRVLGIQGRRNALEGRRNKQREKIKLVTAVVRDELQKYSTGKISSISTDVNLAEMLETNGNSIAEYLSLGLTHDELNRRRDYIVAQQTKRTQATLRAQNKGIYSLTDAQRREIGLRLSKLQTEQTGYFVENRFHAASLQEGAVALLLEKYIPNFGIEPYINFQVSADAPCRFDFCLDNLILEWHPIREQYDDEDDSRVQMMADLKNQIKDKTDKKIYSQFRQEYLGDLAVEYWLPRQEASDNSKFFEGKEVELLRNEKELYQFLSKYTTISSYTQFRKEFRDKCQYVRKFKVEKKKAA